MWVPTARIPWTIPTTRKPSAQHCANTEPERGIILCGSGVGASMAANRIPGIRAGLRMLWGRDASLWTGAVDLPVPGQKYTLGVVEAAQARGDFQVLVERDRHALRVHLGADVSAGLARLQAGIAAALTA